MDSDRTLRPGRRLGPFRLRERLGAGGMAEVWTAERDGQAVALKVIHPHLARDERYRRMFRDEVFMASQLDHPNVVRVQGVLEAESLLLIPMELLDGVNLHVLEVALEKRSERFPLEVAVTIVSRIAAALQAAHEQVDVDGEPDSLIHRDVAPQNIMVTRTGNVKLLDFGVAKAEDRQTRTVAGVVKGRVAYMAPEQAIGAGVTPAVDIFALGVVFWELLAMKRLFVGKGGVAGVLGRPEPPRLDHLVPAEIAHLVESMLRREARDRVRARDVVARLERFLSADANERFAAWCAESIPLRRPPTVELPVASSRSQPPDDEATVREVSGPVTIAVPRAALADEATVAEDGNDERSTVPVEVATASRDHGFLHTEGVALRGEYIIPQDWTEPPEEKELARAALDELPTRAVPSPLERPRPSRPAPRGRSTLSWLLAVVLAAELALLAGLIWKSIG